MLSKKEMEVVAVEMAVNDLAQVLDYLVGMHSQKPDVIAPYRDDIVEEISAFIDEMGIKQ
jgi:hypothetical protein